jgi:thioesterase domain-containing protein/acyl carrier protein
MKHPDPKMPLVKQSDTVAQKTVGASPEGLIEKNQADNPEAAFPQGQTKLEEGRADLWRAVRTVVKSQRQAPLIRPVSRDGEIPLSFAQQRLWFLHQLEPDNPTYNMSIACRITGPLNVAALEQSLGEIVRRHEALRTNFATVEGRPVQVVVPEPTLALQVVDLRELPEPEREGRALRLATEETQRPFDLTQDILLRATLLRLGEEENILVLTTHQIVFDGQSKGVLIRELMTLYEAFSAGKPSPLPALPIQYADFAYWQRQWLQGEVLEAQLSYWQENLGPSVPLLKLPVDHRRPAVQTFRGAAQSFVLPASLSEELRALSQREGVTLFVTLLAAFQTLLYCYTAQEDILVFTSTAGRNRFEIKGLIGLFANLLAIRADLSGTPSFRQLLSRVRKVVLGAYAHQDLPFEQLVETLQPERGLSYTSLFQVMFLFQNEPRPTLELSGLTLSPLNVGNYTAKFDLRLFMVDTEQELTGSLQYKKDLFDATTITRMLGHFQTLLESIVDNPDQRLSDLPLLTEAERRKLPDGKIEIEKNFVAPRDTLELQLTKIWEKVLGKKPIGVRDDFFELGGHSLQAVRLFAQIQKIFGKNIPLAILFQAPTVEQLASTLRDKGWSSSWSSLVAIQPRGSKLPLFCVHGYSGDVLCYRYLARHLGLEQPVYGLQAVGLNRKQPPHTRVEDMATHYIKEIQTLQPEGPYLLAGMCFGAHVALEMAQQLWAQGKKVALLASFDTHQGLGHTPTTKALLFRQRIDLHLGNLSQLGPKEKVAYVVKGAKNWITRIMNRIMKITCKFYLGIGRPLPPALRNFYIREINKRAYRDYVVTRVYLGRVTLFQASARVTKDPMLSWGKVAAGGVEVHVVPSNHSDILYEPNVRGLAEKLRVCLNKAQVAEPG